MNWTLVIVAIIAATPPTIAAFFSRKSTKKDLEEIHVLVNGRLSEALTEIQGLRDYIASGEAKEGGLRAIDKEIPPSAKRTPSRKPRA